MALMIKGGGGSDDWGVMVYLIPYSPHSKSKEVKMSLRKKIERKMVVVGYDRTVSFSEKKQK